MASPVFLSEEALADCSCRPASAADFVVSCTAIVENSSLSSSFSLPPSFQFSSPVARGGSTLTFIPAGFSNFPPGPGALLFGGSNRFAEFFSDLHWFSFDFSCWLRLPSSAASPAPRSGHVAFLLGSNLFIHGGQRVSISPPIGDSEDPLISSEIFSDCWRLDLLSLQWEKLRDGGPKRNGHSATAISDSKVLLFGGSDESGPTNDLFLFDSEEFSFSSISSASENFPCGRELQSASFSPSSDELFITGGRGREEICHDFWSFHWPTKAWRLSGQFPHRCSHTAIAISGTQNKIFSFGGSDGLAFFNDFLIYSPSVVSDSQKADENCLKCNGPAGWRLACGGSGQNVENQEKTEDKNLPEQRFAHALINIPYSSSSSSSSSSPPAGFLGRYLLFGGLNAENDLADTFIIEIREE